MPAKVELYADDLTILATIIESGSYVSRSTGKNFGLIKVEFDADDEQESELVKQFLAKSQPVEIQGKEARKRWRIGDNSHHFTVGTPGMRFSWDLLEEEELKVEKLILKRSLESDSLELMPYRYKEEFDSNSKLTIVARAELTESEEAKLRAIEPSEYFQVIRQGINDTPREMRFGEILWSFHGDKYKMRMFLVDKADDSGWGGLFQPQFRNLSIQTAEASLRLSALLDLLLKKQLISNEEADGVFAIDKKLLNRELLRRNQVDDLDEWLEKVGDRD